MTNAAIIVKFKGDLSSEVIRVLKILDKYNVIPMFDECTLARLTLDRDLKPYTISEMRKEANFVIVLGGDGTLLYTARLFRLINIPMLAFNFGRLGFIMELDISMVEETIRDFMNDKLMFSRRMKLSSEIRKIGGSVEFEEEVLNEIVINKGAPSRMLELSIYIDDNLVSKYRSDGIIVSTPTGSTGYTISAGGPIVHPDMDTIILSPICPHALNMRPIVVPQTSKIEIKIESLNTEAFITFDGQIVKPIDSTYVVRIEKSLAYALIAGAKDRNYYNILRDKLGWGG